MAQLTFFYGEMGCGKTAKLIEAVEDLALKNKRTIVIKPIVDTKNGHNLISRNGKTCAVDYLVNKSDNLIKKLSPRLPVECIFVDEAQFLQKKQIDQLLEIATSYDVPVNAYGLRLNFYLDEENFSGATRLLQISHRLICINSSCDFCKKEQAIFSCVFMDGKIQISGPSILISDGAKEVDAHAICAKCYYKFVSKRNKNN